MWKKPGQAGDVVQAGPRRIEREVAQLHIFGHAFFGHAFSRGCRAMAPLKIITWQAKPPALPCADRNAGAAASKGLLETDRPGGLSYLAPTGMSARQRRKPHKGQAKSAGTEVPASTLKRAPHGHAGVHHFGWGTGAHGDRLESLRHVDFHGLRLAAGPWGTLLKNQAGFARCAERCVGAASGAQIPASHTGTREPSGAQEHA